MLAVSPAAATVFAMRFRRDWAACVVGALAVAAVCGCAGERPTYLENGARGYLVTCGGVLNSWETCLVKAGRICKARGYETIRAVEYDRTLLIACKTPPAK